MPAGHQLIQSWAMRQHLAVSSRHGLAFLYECLWHIRATRARRRRERKDIEACIKAPYAPFDVGPVWLGFSKPSVPGLLDALRFVVSQLCGRMCCCSRSDSLLLLVCIAFKGRLCVAASCVVADNDQQMAWSLMESVAGGSSI